MSNGIGEKFNNGIQCRERRGLMKKYRDKDILIVGFGKSGVAALKALTGVAARVAVYDAKECDAGETGSEVVSYFGGKLPPKDERFDFVILSPGVPPGIEAVVNAVNNGATLTGDLELAYDYILGDDAENGGNGGFVAITGTNGKTTTTALTGEIWRKAGRASAVTGNIGTPVTETALEAAPGCEFITEVSSFQLETIHEGGFRPHIAAFLNLTPDHLDRYETMENYGAAKARAFMNQESGDFLVLNADDAGVMEIAARAYATGLASKQVLFSRRVQLIDGYIYLPGRTEPVTDGAFSINGKIYLSSPSSSPSTSRTNDSANAINPASSTITSESAASTITPDPASSTITPDPALTPSSCGREADRRIPLKELIAQNPDFAANITTNFMQNPDSAANITINMQRTANCEICSKTDASKPTPESSGAIAPNIRYLMDVSELRIPGNHNLENALAATAMAVCGGIDDEIIAATLREFRGVEHRMELIATIGDIRYVNDSKGTNTDASSKAIDATRDGIILIAGGYDKQADFTDFIRGFGGKVRHLILLGETAGRFAATAEKIGFKDYTIVKDMDEAVNLGAGIAKPGETVLLSPASASWDMYDCFEQRGDHFRALVIGLKERING
jgi:UDP-N-acetylmuramoylalanine-D-glutamate ligase